MTPELRASIEKRAHEIVEAFKQDRTAAGLKRHLADEMFGIASLAQQQELERCAKATCWRCKDEIPREGDFHYETGIMQKTSETPCLAAAIRKDQTE